MRMNVLRLAQLGSTAIIGTMSKNRFALPLAPAIDHNIARHMVLSVVGAMAGVKPR